MKQAAARPRLLLVLCLGSVGILYAAALIGLWSYLTTQFSPAHVDDALGRTDFSRLWYVGQRMLAQCFGLGEPGARLHRQFPVDLLSITEQPFQAWLYPPTMNLLAMLFALLPYHTSFWVFTIVTLACGAWILRAAGLSWPVIGLGLFSPAGLFNIFHGQIGALLGSALVASLWTMDTRPRFAGLLGSLLSFKPQVGLALIVVLVQRPRVWMPVCLGVGLIVGLSILVEGIGIWRWFFDVGVPMGARIIDAPFTFALAMGCTSVFMMARSLGMALHAAWALQIFVSFVALALVAAAWRRRLADQRLMAFTVCLAPLISPYGFLYDVTAFGIAMAAMFINSDDIGKIVYACLWLASGFSVLSLPDLGILVFPVFAIIGAAICQPFTSPRNRVARPLPDRPPDVCATGRS